MTRKDLLDLARLGMTQRLKAIEAELATAHKEFPDVFLSETAPQLLRPELRNGHASHWPLVEAQASPTTPRRSKNGKTLGRPKKLTHAERVRANRAASAAVLDFIAASSRPVSTDDLVAAGHKARAIASLARRGYVRKTKRGYMRTGKAFVVDLRRSAEPSPEV